MKRKRPELILTLRLLDATARKSMSGRVQNSLFELGYRWSGGKKRVKHTNRDALRVFTPDWDCRDISYADGVQSSDGAAIFFDASQVLEFLTFAKEFLRGT